MRLDDGACVDRAEDPFWFWTYVATYIVIIAVMLYGIWLVWFPPMGAG